MRTRSSLAILLVLSLRPAAAEAQWADPKLVVGQVTFHVTASFLGKLVFGHEPVGRALRQALREGAVAGLVAHTGYSMAGHDARLALPGKLLAQKAGLMTRRSIHGDPVFDDSLYSDWVLTHSFLHLRLENLKPKVEVDVVNAAFTGYFLLAGDQYRLDRGRTLYTGSFVFRNRRPPAGTQGFYVPGVVWIDEARYDQEYILRHEVIHSFQAERGAGLADFHWRGFRFNPLVFASGVPAFLEGWPEHDRRLHELEADLYAGGG